MRAWASFECETVSGEFTVREISFDNEGKVDALDVTFMQHCDGDEAALIGSLRFQASDMRPRALVRPVTPVVPSHPPAGDTPGGGGGGGTSSRGVQLRRSQPSIRADRKGRFKFSFRATPGLHGKSAFKSAYTGGGRRRSITL